MPSLKLTDTMRKALQAAAARDRGNLCPIAGLNSMLRSAAATSLINALVRRGYVDYNNGSPLITDAGREAVRT